MMSARFRTSMAWLTLGALPLVLSGCATMIKGSSPAAQLGATAQSTAEEPRVVQTLPRVEKSLACIRRSGVLKGRVFTVGPFADSTGKINSVALGATGAFVPQGGSAAYITDAIAKAGGTVVSTYFGPPTESLPTHYMINGIFNSLDFALPFQTDFRIAGIGPVASQGWAQLSLTIQLDQAQTRVNHQVSMIERPVRYSQLGAGIGHTFNGTLVTGSFGTQTQERLQFEALNGPIALGVIDVLMKEFPVARRACQAITEDLLLPKLAQDDPVHMDGNPKADTGSDAGNTSATKVH